MFDALVDGLFPADVSLAWGHVGSEVELFPEEQALVARAVPTRQREFAQGRDCARRALAVLGVARCPLLVGAQREPLWPSGVVGSISHDRELSVAVAGSAGTFAGLGVDVEPDEPLTSEVAARIWSHEEAAHAGASGLLPVANAAKLVFSAKEAVYKCQFALTQCYVGFHAVRVELGDGTFDAQFVEAVGPLAAGRRLRGRWRRACGKLLTAVWVGR
jgi:4'-phosphopantetheinyl transferase EntD